MPGPVTRGADDDGDAPGVGDGADPPPALPVPPTLPVLSADDGRADNGRADDGWTDPGPFDGVPPGLAALCAVPASGAVPDTAPADTVPSGATMSTTGGAAACGAVTYTSPACAGVAGAAAGVGVVVPARKSCATQAHIPATAMITAQA
ncbi:hypothetical protein [Promicromonospora sukumoe]|uniref:hypothetical protein n=1 Tax=Promicromonospora sukumoe TaxID=88382 RepID=UPI000363ADDC|nr:hypothetical protein [Promicromonospora sukumoe]